MESSLTIAKGFSKNAGRALVRMFIRGFGSGMAVQQVESKIDGLSRVQLKAMLLEVGQNIDEARHVLGMPVGQRDTGVDES